MFEKYHCKVAAICLGIYLLGAIFYVFQLLFMTEQWLANELIGPEAIGVARVLGFAYLGYVAGLLMTYKKGPDGHGVFFVSLLVAQIGTFLNLWHQYLLVEVMTTLDDAIIVSVLTALLLVGYIRIRSRL
tara:strand:- start:109 stop:498 length:390 start_codon:yes stop_codon:yes gene_type:complete